MSMAWSLDKSDSVTDFYFVTYNFVFKFLMKVPELVIMISLQWCYNERHGISNHQHVICLLSWLFRCTSKKVLKLRFTGFCDGNLLETGDIPSQKVSSTENDYI